MSKKTGRDTWLYANTRSGKAVQKSAKAAEGRLEAPASEYVQRMLVAPVPRIIHLGSEVAKDGNVHTIKKMVPDYPESHQLKDPFEGLYSQGIALEPPLPPDRLLNLTEENTLHSGCLMAKAYDACGRGWEFAPKDGKKGDKALVESPLPEKMREGMELMTPDLTFGEMLYQAAWESQAIGWAVWEAVRMADQWKPRAYAPIGAIYPIPSFTMRATIDPRRWVQIRAGRVRFFKKFGAKCEVDAETGQVYSWDNSEQMSKISDPNRLASEVIIFKEYSPRSLWYGIPKWISCVPTIAELTAIREFNVSWFASGGQTDYIAHFKADNLEVAREMSAEMRQQMQENQGRGHTNIVVAGTADTEMHVEKLGELLREGHFRFRRSDLAKEVLIAHTVPPYRIGWAETGSGSGLAGNPAGEMLAAYKFGAIQPIQVVIEDRLRQTLFDKDMGIDTGEFRLKLKELELDDMQTELERVTKLVDCAIMTPNQAREELGLDPVEKIAPKVKPVVPGAAAVDGEEADPNAPKNQEQAQPGAPQAPQSVEARKAFGKPQIGPDGKPVQEEPKMGPDGKPLPAGTQPGGDNSGGNLNGPPGSEGEDVGQVEAMNTYYYKGQPLTAKPPAPAPTIGPDGKPQMFGKPIGPDGKPKDGPDGSPVPDPSQKSVDKDAALGVVKEFEKTLQAFARGEESVVGDASAAQDGSPERRPSRRPRRQNQKV